MVSRQKSVNCELHCTIWYYRAGISVAVYCKIVEYVAGVFMTVIFCNQDETF